MKKANGIRVDGRRGRLRWEECMKRNLAGVRGKWRKCEGWGEWRMRVRDGGVENESEGWGSGE